MSPTLQCICIRWRHRVSQRSVQVWGLNAGLSLQLSQPSESATMRFLLLSTESKQRISCQLSC